MYACHEATNVTAARTIRPSKPDFRHCQVALLLPLIVGCSGGGSPTQPQDRPPTITVTGVVDGETRAGPVTITIAVDVGTYQAVLNGEVFLSGRTVSEPASYTLLTTARNGSAVSTLELRFQITLAGESRLIIRIFDLGPNEAGGGGAAILLTDSSSAGVQHALIDAGPAGTGGADMSFVARRLAALGVDTLAALVLSHAHSDHFDGISAVVSGRVVQRFFYNGQQRNFTRYQQVIAEATGRADQVVIPTTVVELQLGLGSAATRLVVLPPIATFLLSPDANGSELNEGSLGVELSKGSFQMFLTGDGEIRANQRWRIDFSDRTRSVDILKVGHHGANDAAFDNGFSGSSAWLMHTAPKVAVISANGATHPRRNAIELLLSLPETRTYCTNVHGKIEIRVGEGGTFFVTPTRNATSQCVAGSEATT